MQIKTTQNLTPPFFSVVVPVYNKGPHINRCISSVLNQTFQNFELILVNDASTDNSLQEIKKFTDDRIRLFQRTEPGPGGYAARNMGINKAKAEWIAFLDADDEWYPNHLEKMFSLAQNYPEVFIMSCGWERENNGNKKETPFYKKKKTQNFIRISLYSYLKYWLKENPPIWTSVACVNKRSPIAIDLFPANSYAKRGGDLFAWLKIMCFHKEMAWSNHLGAVYHLGSVNMVTKQAEINYHLLQSCNFMELSKDLSPKEMILMRKYFNRRLFHEWKLGVLRKVQIENFRPYIYWKHNLIDALIFHLISFIPQKLIRILFSIRKLIKNG